MLVTCMPRASRSSTGMTTTDQETARSTTSWYTRSRAAAVSSFESARPGTRPRRPGGRTHAAATSGPAQAPRPASSAPATASNPRRRSRRSISHRASGRSSSATVRRARVGETERVGLERTAIAGRQYDVPGRGWSGTPAGKAHRAGPWEGYRPGVSGVRTDARSDLGVQVLGRGQAVRAAGAARVSGGQHQGDGVRPVAGPQLAQDRLDVGLDGVLADEQVAADLPVGLPLQQLVQHVLLPSG